MESYIKSRDNEFATDVFLLVAQLIRRIRSFIEKTGHDDAQRWWDNCEKKCMHTMREILDGDVRAADEAVLRFAAETLEDCVEFLDGWVL